MARTKANFDVEDVELAKFTRALALPARIAIIKILLESEDWVAITHFKVLPLTTEVSLKHLNALKTLGLVDKMVQNGIKFYKINADNFKHLAYYFNSFAKSISII